MPYLSNVAINRLNLLSGMHMLGWNLAGGFFIAFLLAHGFSAVAVMLSFAAMLAIRLVLRPMILVIAPRTGLRGLILVGGLLFALQYLVLAHVNGLNTAFVVFIVAQALTDIFYWCGYHAAFSAIGDNHHRGKQVGVREVLTRVATIVAPIVGGWMFVHVGSNAVFGAGAFLECLALLFLVRMPAIPIARKSPAHAFRAGRTAGLLFVTDSWINATYATVWTIMLFGSAHQNFMTYGGALTLTGIVSAIGGLLLGRALDNGHGHHAVLFNGLLLAVGIVLCATAQPALGPMLLVTAISALAGASYTPTLMTAVYNIVGHAPCPLRAAFVMECCWDIGGIVASLTCAAMLSSGIAPGWSIALALLGAIMQSIILSKFYRWQGQG